jgi:hypothetical protein
MDLPGHLSLDGADRLIVARDWRRRAAGGGDLAMQGPAIIVAQNPITDAWGGTTLRREDVLQAIQFADEDALRGAAPEQLAQARRMLADGIGPMTTARMTGLSPEAVSVVRDEMQRAAVQEPALASLRRDEPLRLTPRFRSRLPEVRARLESEFRRMLPPDVVTRLVNHPLFVDGRMADEVVSQSPWHDNLWALSVSLQQGEDVARAKGMHGIAAHILRGYGKNGLYSPQEWRLLLDRARKAGIEQELRRGLTADGSMSLWEAYNRAYARYGREKQQEFLDQELVGRLAEHWAEGQSYGSRIDALLARIARLLEAIRNALRGLGFQSADDIFERVRSGEIARRLEGGRREPTFGPPSKPTYGQASPSPAVVNAIAAQIREALDGRRDELAEDIRFAVGLWQAQGGDPRTGVGEALAEALAAAGHADLAARVAYGGRAPELPSLRSWLGLGEAPKAAYTRPKYTFDGYAFPDAMGPWLEWAESPYATPEARADWVRPGTPEQQDAEWRSLVAHIRREYEAWKAWRERARRAVQEGRRAPYPPPHRGWRHPKR